MNIFRHRNTRGFFLLYENELLLKILMKLRIHYLPSATWLFRPHPPPSDSAPRSTSCQQPRPRPSRWSRRRRRRTARRHEDRLEPVGGVDGGSNPALHAVSCQEEAGRLEKLEPEHRPR